MDGSDVFYSRLSLGALRAGRVMTWGEAEDRCPIQPDIDEVYRTFTIDKSKTATLILLAAIAYPHFCLASGESDLE